MRKREVYTDIKTEFSLSGKLKCAVCKTPQVATFSGMCVECYQENNCPKCFRGKLRNTGTPNWQNRWTCSNCKKHTSR